MDLMPFLESMSSSDIGVIAAFFIGIMMSLSPCPLASNITAVAFISKDLASPRKTMVAGIIYTLGRMASYVSLAALIVYAGMNTSGLSFFLQSWGERLLGPFLIILGLLMLEKIRLPEFSKDTTAMKQYLAKKGYLGHFMLGAALALAFCPLSAVLFFGMLIPLALAAKDAILIPSSFALATGLPVIFFALILTTGTKSISDAFKKSQALEKSARRITGVLFLLVGIYYLLFI